jgi:hypothetical protein
LATDSNKTLYSQAFHVEARVEIDDTFMAASLNTLIYKAILTLILKGFNQFLALHATYWLQLGTYTPLTLLLKKSLKVSLKVFWRKQHKRVTENMSRS